MPVQELGDETGVSRRAVVGCDLHLDTGGKQVPAHQIATAPGAIQKPGVVTRRQEARAEQWKRGDSDPACDQVHRGLGVFRRREWPPQGSDHGDPGPGLQAGKDARASADNFVQKLDRGAVGPLPDACHGERPAQKGIGTLSHADHDELRRFRARADLRRVQNGQKVVMTQIEVFKEAYRTAENHRCKVSVSQTPAATGRATIRPRMSSSSRPHRPPRFSTTLARMAVNATLAGAWAAALLALLPFYLNADVSLNLRNYLSLALPLILFYAPASGLMWALLAGLVRLFAAFRVRVPWIGFRPFWRFLVADLCVLTLLFGLNLRYTRDYLPAAMIRHLQVGTTLLAVVALLLAVDALWRGLGRGRTRPAQAVVVMLLLTAGMFAIRDRYRPTDPPRSASEIQPSRPTEGVLLLGLEGASPGDFLPMVADGRLPHFSALLSRGSSAPLRAPRPPRPAAAWASVRTGLSPASHRVIGDQRLLPLRGEPVFHLPPAGLLVELPAALGLLRLESGGRTIPRVVTGAGILARCGYRVVEKGWPGQPATSPPLTGRGVAALPSEVAVHVKALRHHLDVARRVAGGPPLARVLSKALASDLVTGRSVMAALEAGSDGPPWALMVRFTGLDRVGRAFLRYQRPDQFGNVTADELDAFGAVLPEYYRFLDAWLGVLVEAVGSGARVMVVSPYGLEPVDVMTRVRNALSGQWHDTGTDRDGPPGILLAAGPGFREGGRLERARAVDVLPTLLYILDLPVGRDMDGQPLPQFASDEFAEHHAISAVPSWETVTVVPPPVVW